MFKSKQIVSRSIAKLLEYKILFKNKHTFLGLVYRDAQVLAMYLVVKEIIIQKSDEQDNYIT